MFQIRFQSSTVSAAIEFLRALQQRCGTVVGGATGTAFDAVELTRDGNGEFQDKIDALLRRLLDDLGEVVHDTIEAVLAAGYKLRRGALIANRCPIFDEL